MVQTKEKGKYLAMVYAIVSIGGLGFIVWSRDGFIVLKEIIKKLNCVTGNSLESEVKLTKEKVTGEFIKSSELENQQETLPKKKWEK